jgi:hypothetical protein
MGRLLSRKALPAFERLSLGGDCLFVTLECENQNCEQKVSVYIPNSDRVILDHACLCGSYYLIEVSVLKEKGGKQIGISNGEEHNG